MASLAVEASACRAVMYCKYGRFANNVLLMPRPLFISWNPMLTVIGSLKVFW